MEKFALNTFGMLRKSYPTYKAKVEFNRYIEGGYYQNFVEQTINF